MQNFIFPDKNTGEIDLKTYFSECERITSKTFFLGINFVNQPKNNFSNTFTVSQQSNTMPISLYLLVWGAVEKSRRRTSSDLQTVCLSGHQSQWTWKGLYLFKALKHFHYYHTVSKKIAFIPKQRDCLQALSTCSSATKLFVFLEGCQERIW